MVILIPAYQPDHRLPALVSALLDARPGTAVIVVDDGSGQSHAPHFVAARAAGAAVIGHPDNRGKGYALRAGFQLADLAYPGHDVVCADADGQHRVEDILAVAARVDATGRIVLGVRRFTGRVPLRSRFGNAVTRLLFTLASGQSIWDTQTGLRGYPATVLTWLDSIPGDGFDYETRTLLAVVEAGLALEPLDIATVYLDGNASSHFRSVADSVRVCRPLLAFALGRALGRPSPFTAGSTRGHVPVVR